MSQESTETTFTAQRRKKNGLLLMILLIFIAMLYGMSFVKFGQAVTPQQHPAVAETPRATSTAPSVQ